MRYELKIILDECSLIKAEHWMLAKTNCHSSYPDRIVNSLYFDDVGYSSLRDNLAGISQRKKSRLRWYGPIQDGISLSPRFEFKSRNGRLGDKESFPLPQFDDNLLQVKISKLYDEIINNLPKGSTFPLDDFLVPSLQVSYLRSYFEAPNGLRVTFDKDILFFAPDGHKSINQLIKIDYAPIVMEIKFDIEQKNQVALMLQQSDLVPKRHSKYLAGMANLGLATYY